MICSGTAMFVRFTPLGDEVRRCESCGSEFVTRAIAKKKRPGYDPGLWRCGSLVSKTRRQLKLEESIRRLGG